MKSQDVTLILLASGRSERFGRANKLTADLRGQPLVRHAATALAGMGWRRNLATIADETLRPMLEGLGYDTVQSDDPHAGMGDNLALAAANIEDGAVLVALADMPFVTTAHIEALLRAAVSPRNIVVSRAKTLRAPPVLFGAGHLTALKSLTGDEGARQIIAAHVVNVVEVETAAQSLFDIDTPDDLAIAQTLKIPL